MKKYRYGRAMLLLTLCAVLWVTAPGSTPTYAFGEAGPLRLAQFGNFVVNAQLTEEGGVTRPDVRGVHDPREPGSTRTRSSSCTAVAARAPTGSRPWTAATAGLTTS